MRILLPPVGAVLGPPGGPEWEKAASVSTHSTEHPDDVIIMECAYDVNNGFSAATAAAFGSYMEPHVMALRRFRDEILLQNPAGRAFVRAYYKYSPPPADFIAARSWLRATVRILLLPVVAFSWLALHQPLCLAGLMILPLVGLIALRRRRNTA